jgi:hypothetical protein
LVSRRLKRYAALGLAAIAAGALAAVLVPRGGATARWEWPGGVPGATHIPTAVERGLAQRSSVDPASIREVVSAGHFRLLAGRRGSDVCLGTSTGTIASSYECASELSRPLFLQTFSEGGAAVDRYELVGVARNDVRRVELQLSDGSTQSLPLRRWRAFAFAAARPAPMPVEITAYDSGGPIGSEDISASAPR